MYALLWNIFCLVTMGPQHVSGRQLPTSINDFQMLISRTSFFVILCGITLAIDVRTRCAKIWTDWGHLSTNWNNLERAATAKWSVCFVDTTSRRGPSRFGITSLGWSGYDLATFSRVSPLRGCCCRLQTLQYEEGCWRSDQEVQNCFDYIVCLISSYKNWHPQLNLMQTLQGCPTALVEAPTL